MHTDDIKFANLRGEMARRIKAWYFIAGGWMGGHTVDASHPCDEQRFWRFVRYCHAHSSTLSPEQLSYDLHLLGLRPDLIRRLCDKYAFGRRLLADRYWPWTRRTRRRQAATSGE